MRCSVVLLLVALTVAAVSAANDLPQALMGFSGNWDNTQTMMIPSWSSDGSCTAGTSAYHYAYFTIVFNGDGVRRFSSFEYFDYVFYYNGTFNAAMPCQNGARLYDDGSGVEYNFDGYAWFWGNVNYTFVVADSYSSGEFTGQITEGWQGSTTNTTNMRWNPTYISSSGCTSNDQGTDNPFYAKATFTVDSTGYYDVEAYYARNADGDYPSYTYLAVFRGTPNASVETDACGAIGDGVELLAADYGSYLYSEVVAVRFVVNVTYTVIVSNYYDNFWGPFGWRITTTRRFNFTTPVGTTSSRVGGFTEPPRDSDYYGLPGFACTTNSNGYDNMPYAVVTFNVPEYQNFTVLTTEPHDYAFFMYTGENINPPTACLTTGRYIDYRDSGSERDFGAIDADDFTIVATPWSTSTDATGYYMDVYLITGPAITPGGYVPPVTTSSPVTTTNGPNPVTTTVGPNPVTTTNGPNPVTTTVGPNPVTTTRTPATTTRSPATTSSSDAATVRVFASAVALVAVVAVFFM